jgi:hypothetical protein
MPRWKTRTLLVLFAFMAISGVCLSQVDEAPRPSTPASSASRGGSPSPYIAPIVVPSAAGQITPLRPSVPAIPLTTAPAPTFSSACDSTGCWGSDGTRYNAIGGSLVRPDGRNCQSISGVMTCP